VSDFARFLVALHLLFTGMIVTVQAEIDNRGTATVQSSGYPYPELTPTPYPELPTYVMVTRTAPPPKVP
jgi:hypothetical protein